MICSHAGPAFQVLKKHSRPVCLANRISPEGTQEGRKDGEFIWLLPFSCFLLGKSQVNSPPRFQVALSSHSVAAYETRCISGTFHPWLEANSAWVGCWPRKRKVKMIKESWKIHRVWSKIETFNLVSSMWKMDRQDNEKKPHWARK